VIPDFLRVCDAFRDPRLSSMAREAVYKTVPHGGGSIEAMKFYGDNLTAVLLVIAPVITSLDEMIPGFRNWLETSGYGDDRYMLGTLFAIADKLEQMPKPGRTEMRERALATWPAPAPPN
jgi:hypothetical protein